MTGSFFESAGLTPGVPLALLAGTAELTGGLLLGIGLFLPGACLLLVAVMATAIAAVHWKNGLWASDGGFEFPLVMGAAAFAVTAIGAGRYSLDNLLGIDWASPTWAIGATVVGGLAGLVTVALPHITHRTHRTQPHTA